MYRISEQNNLYFSDDFHAKLSMVLSTNRLRLFKDFEVFASPSVILSNFNWQSAFVVVIIPGPGWLSGPIFRSISIETP